MDIQTLTLLLTNPLTFGALISWVCEQLAFFRDERVSPAAKIAVVIGLCQLWSAAAFALNDTGQSLTVAVVRTIVYNGLAVAVASQIFHVLVNKLLPGLADFLLSLKTTTTIANATSFSTGDSSGSHTEVKTGPTEAARPATVPFPSVSLGNVTDAKG